MLPVLTADEPAGPLLAVSRDGRTEGAGCMATTELGASCRLIVNVPGCLAVQRLAESGPVNCRTK
jgi:hypothetical protein